MRLGEFANRILKVYYKIPVKLGEKVSKKARREITASFCETIEKNSYDFASILFRPKKSDLIHVMNKELTKNNEKIGIVIQGPPLFKDSFTLETISFYKKMFDNIEIILSTWDDVDSDYLDQARKLGCDVIVNKKPSVSGMGNMNFQIISSLAGIRAAKQLGCKYVMKTRTDQRLYNYNACNFLIDLIKTFPTTNHKQNSRIIVVQKWGGSLFLPFNAADFFYFGEINDMEKLFDLPLDANNFKNRADDDNESRKLSLNNNLGTVFHLRAPENKILEGFAKKVGFPVEITVKSYWEFIRQSIIGISTEEIGLYWKKYSRSIVENMWTHHYEPMDSDDQLLTYNLTFTNWLSIYTGSLEYREEYEKYRMRKHNF